MFQRCSEKKAGGETFGNIIYLVGGLEHQCYFPIHIGFLIIPIDEVIFFRTGWLKTTKQLGGKFEHRLGISWDDVDPSGSINKFGESFTSIIQHDIDILLAGEL